MGDNILSVANIRGLGGSDVGQFRASSEQLGWKNKKTGQVLQYKGSELKEAIWVKGGPSCALILVTEEGPARFDGFQDRDFETVGPHFLKNFNIEIQKKKMSLKGWNWGSWNVDSNNFSMNTDDKIIMEFPTNSISQVILPSKTDITVEFANKETNDPEDVQTVEMRFYIPNSKDESGQETSLIGELKDSLNNNVTQSTSTSDVVTVLEDTQLLVPRGRHEIDLSLTAMRFHGRSVNFNVPYEHISVVFVLPKPDTDHAIFVIGLTQHVRQGATKYPFLVIQIDSKVETNLQLRLPEERLAELGLQAEMSGHLYRLFSQLLIKLVKKPLLTPGEYKSFTGSRGINASVKADHGVLYPLNKHLLFLHKPVIWVPMDQIVVVEFENTGGTRYFEMKVSCKNGIVHEFGSIEKNELSPLLDFLKTRVTVKAEQAGEAASKNEFNIPGLSDDDEDDSSYIADSESEEDDDFTEDDESESGDESGSKSDEKSKKKKEKKDKKKDKKEKKEKKKEKKEKKEKKKEKKEKKKREKSGESDVDGEPSSKRVKTEE